MGQFSFFRRSNHLDDETASILFTSLRPLRITNDVLHTEVVSASSRVARDTHAVPERAVQPVLLPATKRRRAAVFALAAMPVAVIAALILMIAPSTSDDFFLDETLALQTAIIPRFTPLPMPADRGDDYVIVTSDVITAAEVNLRLIANGEEELLVLAERPNQITFSVPLATTILLTDLDLSVQPDTRITALNVHVQSPVPSWGLDRLDALNTPLDDSYSYRSDGSGIRIYVVDTGIRADHRDFRGRVASGWSGVADGQGTNDCNGHGTHVAGTVAGENFGVAKQSTVVPVRVLDCAGNGFASSIVAGVSWIMANHPGGPAIINVSVGGPANTAIDDIVTDAAQRGYIVIAAAGNDRGDACAVSPARARGVITIGATTSSDARASFSNTGSCVDLYAPGKSITSVWHTSNTATATLSGTSMATPHVAGLVARLWQLNPDESSLGIRSLLEEAAAKNTTAPQTMLLAHFVYAEETCPSDDAICGDATKPVDEPVESRQAPQARIEGSNGASRVSPRLRARSNEHTSAPTQLPRMTGVTAIRLREELQLKFIDRTRAISYVVACSQTLAPTPFGDTAGIRVDSSAISHTGVRVSVVLPDQFSAAARCRISGIYDDVVGPASDDVLIPASARNVASLQSATLVRPDRSDQPATSDQPDTSEEPATSVHPDPTDEPATSVRPDTTLQRSTPSGPNISSLAPGTPSPDRPNPPPTGPRR